MIVGVFGYKMKLGHSGAGKMAERIKCLLLKREDLNLDAQHTQKARCVSCIITPALWWSSLASLASCGALGSVREAQVKT